MNAPTKILVIAFLALAAETFACSVPVFRYALERWPADAYRMTIFARGALSDDQRTAVDAVRNAGEDGLVNLGVRVIDVTGQLTGVTAKLWAAQGKPDLPWVIVQYPVATEFEEPFEQGALDAKFVQRVLGSPVRREVGRRILQGESVVWVLLESGDKNQDDKVAKMLQAECKKLADLIEVPPVDPNDPRTDVNVTLKIAFSVVRLSRTNPDEQFLVKQLAHIQPRFAEAKGPLVFPVFGRGRALCGLTEDEITPDNIEQVAVFLTGACSCEVKAMNPGVDLLFSVDWDAALEGRAVKDPEMPPLVSLSQLAAEAKPPVKVEEAPAPKSQAAPLTRNLIIAIGLGIVVVVAGALLLRSNNRKQ